MDATALDDVLDRFAKTGPEFGPGLSNHGPMAAEALVAMGRADAAPPWSDWYVRARRLGDHPQSRYPIVDEDWREALGDIKRAGDWIAFFDGEVRERPWRDVLETWVARLNPGTMATHGVLRTAHAVRSLTESGSPSRLHELAEGLGYWAARYHELPTTSAASGSLRVQEALPLVERIVAARRVRGLLSDAVKGVEPAAFGPVVNLVDLHGDVNVFVSDLTRTFVRQYLANAQRASIAFIHCVTGPSALRIMVPHLSEATGREAMRYAWQACAAMYAAYGDAGAEAALSLHEPVPFDAEDLIDQAVAARDEHAIKFTEACLREYRISADPAFIVAIRDVVVRERSRN